MRKDKDKVLDMLFNAFAKHQYYSIKDLERITQQPTVSKTFFNYFILFINLMDDWLQPLSN